MTGYFILMTLEFLFNMKFLKKISDWIDNQIPQAVKVQECVMRDVIAVYNLHINNEVAFFNNKADKAIDRIIAQIEENGSCTHEVHTYLLYKEDKAAIRRLLNNYCLFIAERHSAIRCKAFKHLAFLQYEKYTKMMKLFY